MPSPNATSRPPEAILNHFDRNALALAVVAAAGRGSGGLLIDLLDAEADAFLLDVDIQHLCLNDIALVVTRQGFFALGVPRDVAEVDHAVQFRREADKQAELGDVS